MLTRLWLRDFRCFEQVELMPHPRLTIFTGRNAQGKTSLLEALCVLMRLQSPRTSSRGDWLKHQAVACAIEGDWSGRWLRYTQTAAARRLTVDGGVCARQGEYLAATARVVWMDREDMNLVRGGAEHRRRWLDFAAAQLFPDYLPALRHYERALRARNFLLKRDASIAWRQVESYDVLLDQYGRVIRRGRAELLRRMQPWITEMQNRLGGDTELAEAHDTPGYSGDDLLAVLRAQRDSEARTRQTSFGTHRDDVSLHINHQPASSFASEGQQRTLSLSMKLAQARVLEEGRGEAPLLLLDDIFGELDVKRRHALFDHLPSKSQKLITTTALEWKKDGFPDAEIWRVADGRVERA
jgi:DNA replication and repair protein RecF